MKNGLQKYTINHLSHSWTLYLNNLLLKNNTTIDIIKLKLLKYDALQRILYNKKWLILNCFYQNIECTVVNHVILNKQFTLYYIFTNPLINTSEIGIYFTITEKTLVKSLILFCKNSTWLETEVFDLFGLFFLNNQNLRRLLTDYGFQGNAFKKNFPLVGYKEILYSNKYKLIMYKPVKLAQGFRVNNIK